MCPLFLYHLTQIAEGYFYHASVCCRLCPSSLLLWTIMGNALRKKDSGGEWSRIWSSGCLRSAGSPRNGRESDNFISLVSLFCQSILVLTWHASEIGLIVLLLYRISVKCINQWNWMNSYHSTPCSRWTNWTVSCLPEGLETRTPANRSWPITATRDG